MIFCGRTIREVVGKENCGLVSKLLLILALSQPRDTTANFCYPNPGEELIIMSSWSKRLQKCFWTCELTALAPFQIWSLFYTKLYLLNVDQPLGFRFLGVEMSGGLMNEGIGRAKSSGVWAKRPTCLRRSRPTSRTGFQSHTHFLEPFKMKINPLEAWGSKSLQTKFRLQKLISVVKLTVSATFSFKRRIPLPNLVNILK